MNFLIKNMKAFIFKNKNGDIHGWATGGAGYSVKITEPNGQEYVAEKEEIELSEDEGQKLAGSDYKPIKENGKIKIIKR